MPRREPNHWPRARSALALAALVLAAGCASTTAPSGWLPGAEEAQRDAYGGWIEVHPREGLQPKRILGELIAVAPDSLHVLTIAGLVGFARGDVERATLFGYESPAAAFGGWTALGTLSTLSHGFGLIYSAPVWLITGIGVTANASREARIQYPQDGWLVMRPHARFPAGWPEGLDRSTLSIKPGTPADPPERYRHRTFLDR
jgi:hypothetical protein